MKTFRTHSRAPMARLLAAGLAVVFFSVMGAGVGGATSASATSGATGANFIATGHDLDYHCNDGDANECAYLKIAVDKVRNGSTLPVLSIDDGSTLTAALADAGVSNVEVIDPSDAATFNSLAFTSPSGVPLYSAIVVASSNYVTDISDSDSATINARAADFKTFFNGGGGILALSSAGMPNYYDFLPIPVTGTSVSAPFTVTSDGAALGITSAMVNCCMTHNSFATPASPLVTLETDSAGASETIAGFGAKITGGAFAPAAPTVTVDGGDTVFTRNTTPTITGTTTAVSGSAVSVTIDGQTLTTTVSATGTWMVTAASMPEGTYDVVATIIDSTTALTGTATQSLTVDTTAPVVAINNGPAVLTNNPVFPISGTTDAAVGTTVTVTVASQTLTTSVEAGGTWTVNPTALSDGPHSVNASIIDHAGNTGSADQIVTVDTSAPAVTIDGGAIAARDTDTPALTGTSEAPAGTPVTVIVGGQTLPTTIAVGGTWSVTPSTLSDGPYVLTASVTDLAGNIGTATQALTIDTIAPVVGIDGGETALTAHDEPAVTGTTDAEPGTSVTVTVGVQILTTTVTPLGTWTVTPTTLDDASYVVTATVIDEAGNVGTAEQELTVDTTPPVVTIDGGLMRVTNSPTITGTTDAAPETPVTVTVGTQVMTGWVTLDGTWSVTTTDLEDGTYSVDVSITDPAGNIGSLEHGLTLDTVAPVVGIDGGASVVVNSSTPTITGTTDADPETEVTVSVGGQVLNTTVTADGTWSVTPVDLADGTYAVVASVTDLAGNTGTADQSLVAGPAAVVLDLGFAVGSTLDGSIVTIAGSGLADGSTLDLQVFSTPQALGSSVVASNGATAFTAVMPANLPAGVHHLLLSGTSSSGAPITMTKWFTINASGKVLAVSSTGPTPTLAELAMTGGTVNIGSDVIVGLLTLLLGAGLLMRRSFRRTNSTHSISK